MNAPLLIVTAATAILLAPGVTIAGAAKADVHYHRLALHRRHGGETRAHPATASGEGRFPGYGFGRDPRPNGGFVVDPYGNGNYTRGADGGFGGYPPGSAGAEELMNNQREKCDFAPRTC